MLPHRMDKSGPKLVTYTRKPLEVLSLSGAQFLPSHRAPRGDDESGINLRDRSAHAENRKSEDIHTISIEKLTSRASRSASLVSLAPKNRQKKPLFSESKASHDKYPSKTSVEKPRKRLKRRLPINELTLLPLIDFDCFPDRPEYKGDDQVSILDQSEPRSLRISRSVAVPVRKVLRCVSIQKLGQSFKQPGPKISTSHFRSRHPVSCREARKRLACRPDGFSSDELVLPSKLKTKRKHRSRPPVPLRRLELRKGPLPTVAFDAPADGVHEQLELTVSIQTLNEAVHKDPMAKDIQPDQPPPSKQPQQNTPNKRASPAARPLCRQKQDIQAHLDACFDVSASVGRFRCSTLEEDNEDKHSRTNVIVPFTSICHQNTSQNVRSLPHSSPYSHISETSFIEPFEAAYNTAWPTPTIPDPTAVIIQMAGNAQLNRR